MEMAKAIVPELVFLDEEGIEAYDALMNEPVIVLAPVMCILADNPRASELLNHLGGSARRYCRMCMVRIQENILTLLLLLIVLIYLSVQ